MAVMESTGVYWKPVFYGLEGRVPRVWLVNAQHVKNVPGRKTDMCDAEWLADVAAHGMVRASFVPELAERELRELTRYRKTQVKARAQEILRLEKLLQDAGIKLSSFASGVWSKSSRAMVEALIGGVRDPVKLAELAKGRMRSKIPSLVEGLANYWREHHSTVARQVLAHIDFLDRSIEELTNDIVSRLVPLDAALALLCTIPGVSTLTAQVMIAEMGTDMSRFPTPQQLASWAGVAPGNNESAGRRKPAGTRPGNRHLREAITEAARAASRTKKSYLSAKYSRIARRRGPNKAATAIARTILHIAWTVLSTGEIFQDPGPDYYTPKHKLAHHKYPDWIQQLQNAGYTITAPAA